MEIVSVFVKAKCFERNEQIKGSEVRRPIPGYKSPWKHWHFHILSFGKLYSTPEHLSCSWKRFEILNAVFYWEPFNHFVAGSRGEVLSTSATILRQLRGKVFKRRLLFHRRVSFSRAAVGNLDREKVKGEEKVTEEDKDESTGREGWG